MSECLVGTLKCGCTVRALVIGDTTKERRRQSAFIRECLADDMIVSKKLTEWVRSNVRRCTHGETTKETV